MMKGEKLSMKKKRHNQHK